MTDKISAPEAVEEYCTQLRRRYARLITTCPPHSVVTHATQGGGGSVHNTTWHTGDHVRITQGGWGQCCTPHQEHTRIVCTPPTRIAQGGWGQCAHQRASPSSIHPCIRLIEGSLPCAKKTAEILRLLITTQRHTEREVLIDDVRSVGFKIQAAKPVGESACCS